MKTLYAFYVGLLLLPGWAVAQDCAAQKQLLSQLSAVQNACPNTYAIANLVVDQCEGRIGPFEFSDRAKPLFERIGATETQPGSACYQAKLKAGIIKDASGRSNIDAYRAEEAEKKRQDDIATQRVQSAAEQVLQNSNELISTDFNMNMDGVNNALSNVENTNIDLNSRLGQSTTTRPTDPAGQNVAADWNASPERTQSGISSERPQVAASPAINTPAAKPAPSTWNNHENLFEKVNPDVLYYRTHTPTPGRPRSYGGGEFGNEQPQEKTAWEGIKNKFSNWFGNNRTADERSRSDANSDKDGRAYSLGSNTADRFGDLFNKTDERIWKDEYVDADAEGDRFFDETKKHSWNVFQRVRKEPRKGFDEDDAKKVRTDLLNMDDN